MGSSKFYTIAILLATLSYLEAADSVEMRLVDGSSADEGTILVRRRGQGYAKWGLVCDDGWHARAGQVVCRQLGYKKVKKVTRYNTFNTADSYDIFLDDVRCSGREKSIADCRHRRWYSSDCSQHEAAGVICAGKLDHLQSNVTAPGDAAVKVASVKPKVEDVQRVASAPESAAVPADVPADVQHANPSKPPSAAVRIQSVKMLGGRNPSEGYVKVQTTQGLSGTICSDNWSLREAMVVCRQLGLQYASRATGSDFFHGGHEDMIMSRVNCTGHESTIADCLVSSLDSASTCSRPARIAGVICTTVLPDLMPNVTALAESVTLQDRYLGYLTCAMEENCLASSAYEAKESNPRSWQHMNRRLLRFSSSIYNNGTSDFRPRQHRSSWQWHECHMHYHSMDTFSHYDVLDSNGVRVAEGHKASFCLEDVECDNGVRKKYSCRGYGDQGISVGCADVYKATIDCQWIDITDIEPGNYVFKFNINPNYEVPELDFDNNAATCDLAYTGFSAKLTNCRLSRG